MARLTLHFSSGLIALAAASTMKVFGQIVVPANHRIAITSIGAFGNDATATDNPVQLKITRSTAGTGALSGGTLTKKNPDDAETPNTTAGTTWATTPPAAGTVIETFTFHPQQGFKEFFPPGQEIIVGGSALSYLAFEVTTGAVITGSPSVTIECDIEE